MANEEIKEKNLQLALKKTFEIMLNVGIEGANREMLIRECGLSRATISRYFSNKTDWVLKTAGYVGEYLDESISFNANLEGYEDILGVDLLRNYLEIGRNIFIEDKRLFILWGEFKIYVYRHNMDITEINATLDSNIGHRKIIEKIFEKGINDGSIVNNMDIQYNSDMVCKIFYGYLINSALDASKSKESAIEEIDTIIDALINEFSRK